MAVPYTFGSATTSIPLSQLDSNFATTITLGNTAIQLGNTVTTLNNMTLANVTISSGTSNVSSTSIVNGTSNVTIASSGGAIAMATNGATAITVDTSQNVGIGATSPATKLDVNGSISIASSGNLTWGGAYGAGIPAIAVPTAGSLGFYPNGSTSGEKMRIDSSGNVGIGVTSPSTRLDVRQSSASDLQLSLYNNNAGVYATSIKLNADNATGSYYNAIQSYNATTAQWQIGGAGSSSTIVFGTGSSFTERARVNAYGIGLGGAVPSSGTGIAFPATQSASSDANTLDDYEEGTWTPTQGGGLTVVGTFSSGGNYTKIGRMVYLAGYVSGTTSVTAAAAAVFVGGLPFGAITGPQQPGVGIVAPTTSGGFVLAYSTTMYAVTAFSTTTYFFNVAYQV